MSREAMQLALEVLEKVITAFGSGLTLQQNAITALRQALVDADDTSQKRVDEMVKIEHDKQIEIALAYQRGWDAALAQQEPVAWLSEGGDVSRSKRYMDEMGFKCNPLYTAPPNKEWVGLTDEEIQDLSYLSQKIDASNSEWFDRLGFAKAIEQVLKEKNT